MAERTSGTRAPAEPAARQPHWLGIHLHYRDDLDALLREAVRPLVQELLATGVAADFFFLRYWDGGSHIRLRLALTDPGEADRASEAVARHVTPFFQRRPARENLSCDEYARVAADLAARENLAHYHHAQRPNNSFEFVPYRPEYDRYGTGRSLAAVESHFCESSRAALAFIDREPSRVHRDLTCLSVLLLAWFGTEIDLGTLAKNVRELCDAWGSFSSTVDVETALERQREHLTGLADRLHSLRPPSTRAATANLDGSYLDAWAGSFQRLERSLDRADGDALRVLDTCAHLTCNRLGAPLPDELYLRQLASRVLCGLSEGS